MRKILLIFIHILIIGTLIGLILYKPEPEVKVIGTTETSGTETQLDKIKKTQDDFYSENKTFNQVLKTEIDDTYSYKVDLLELPDGKKGFKVTEYEKRKDGNYIKTYTEISTKYETDWKKIE